MDKVAKYKKIVRQLVAEIGDEGSSSYPEIETLKVLDDENGQYLLMNSGWRGERRTYGNFLHVEVKPDGKVWLEHDGTDLEV
ncbi:MAG: element excision factor XisI family protein, partial [Bacteroidota bacterium]